MPTEPQAEDQSPVEIRKFDPAQFDRAGFDCGVPRLNNFIQRSAKKQQKDDIVRVYVATRPGERIILGYHSLNAYSLAADDLGPLKPKATPPHNTLPALYLSMIAVSLRAQGAGLGSILLDHAKQKALAVADTVGAHAMVLDVMEDGGENATARRMAWYAKHGFQTFPDAPLKMFLPVATIRRTYAMLNALPD
ncbi:GNAT family N-acetyltransferase [Breoghania sp.]|uniref:GNAT family N-acetyltransferase n=1 Tax=Breoghania sp. TaxID=2065378 RepID=UPI002AA77624|nr:GNAT family N-acetyltransferase [Breoghania sp.]